jgi:hypothetical protein
MLRVITRLFAAPPRTAQALAPVQQDVITALCREIQDLRRRLDERDGGPAVLTPINPASRCPAVSGSASSPAGCPRVSSNYAADGLYTGDPKNWVPPACPLCG